MRTHPKTTIVLASIFGPLLVGMLTAWAGIGLAPGILGTVALAIVLLRWPDQIINWLDDLMREQVSSGRHEYDHAHGYDGANQLYVEPVCQTCHRNREEARRGEAA